MALNATPASLQGKGALDRPAASEPPLSFPVVDPRQHDIVNISVQLNDGRWLNFIGLVPKATLLWSGPATAYVLTTAAGVMLLAVWMVRRVTAPLTSFARAAGELGRNIRSEPLPETGPREVVQASQAFNEMQARIRRLVENRTQMLAAISHDLRTPLTLVRLRAELLGEGGNAEDIIRSLDELDRLITAIMAFSKETFEDEQQRSVDLAALLGSLCDDLADAGAAVEFTMSGSLPYSCRRVALRRAFTNLIENAVKYGGGARVGLAASQVMVQVVIDDDGPGIPEEEMTRVFMPFYRLDQSRSRETGGTGLGLSIAQSIIHGHGGIITLANRAAGGLRVRVSLPR